jgi:predicted transcriptional regulator of viral defense system
MASKILKKIKEIGKDFYTIPDLEKISGLKKKSLFVALSRLEKKEEILRIAKGFYILPEQKIDAEKIATQIYAPSYVSFESALARYGILSQIPYAITLATTRKPKTISILGKLADYRRIKKELFFGFSLAEGVYAADPEKALLDTLYFVSLGRTTLSFEELDLSKIDKPKFWRYAKLYPARVQKQAKKIVK